MGSTQVYHDPEFLKEVWGLFGVGCLVLVLRFIVRLRTVGIRKFEGDDYLVILVLLCYTADAVTVTLTYLNGSNVDYTPEALKKLDPQENEQVIFGSKMQLFAWYTYTALIWGLKACMLFFLNRLTFGLNSQTVVKALAVVCAVTYLVVFLTITVSCHPIQLNWQTVPYPPVQCTLRAQNMYVSTILNVITDGAILSVPMPLLWKLKVPLRKKLTLAALLSSGVFVITAALVRIVMSLKAHPSALTINRWGVRETIAGIIAVNIPIIRPLFSKAFWTGDLPSSTGVPKRHQSSGKSSRSMASAFRKPDAFEMRPTESASDLHDKKSGAMSISRQIDGDSDGDHDEDTASDDLIIQKSDSDHGRNTRKDIEKGHNGVLVETSYSQDVRALTPPAPVELPNEPARPAAAQSSWTNGRFWDSDWEHRGFGNTVTVGTSGNKMTTGSRNL